MIVCCKIYNEFVSSTILFRFHFWVSRIHFRIRVIMLVPIQIPIAAPARRELLLNIPFCTLTRAILFSTCAIRRIIMTAMTILMSIGRIRIIVLIHIRSFVGCAAIKRKHYSKAARPFFYASRLGGCNMQ